MTICAYIFSFCYNCVCNVHVPIPRAMAFGTVINVARESIATLKSSVIYDISLKVKLQFIQLGARFWPKSTENFRHQYRSRKWKINAFSMAKPKGGIGRNPS